MFETVKYVSYAKKMTNRVPVLSSFFGGANSIKNGNLEGKITCRLH
jgi:hypothetical protein